MRNVVGFPFANGGSPVSLALDTEVPDFDLRTDGFENRARDFYNCAAERFMDTLSAYAPGGFVDALHAELCMRKASILRVTSRDLVREHKRTLALEEALRDARGDIVSADRSLNATVANPLIDRIAELLDERPV